MKLGTVVYCPPKNKLNSEAFMRNISQYKASNPLYLISDDAAWNPSRLIKSPEMIGRKPAFAINNFIFLAALELARDVGLTYFLWLESDSRVGCSDFDALIFSEFFERYPNGVACAGSPVCWDAPNGGKEFAMRIVEEAWRYQQASKLPLSFHGDRHPSDPSGVAYYPNGSCALYETAALLKIFAGFERDIAGYSRIITAYDLQIGRNLWNYHGPNAINHVGWLTTLYSGFGDLVVNYEERKAMLLSGRVAAVHQAKDDWTP